LVLRGKTDGRQYVGSAPTGQSFIIISINYYYIGMWYKLSQAEHQLIKVLHQMSSSSSSFPLMTSWQVQPITIQNTEVTM